MIATREEAPKEALMTIGQVSVRLRVCERTLRYWIASGKFPKPIRAGRGIRYRPSDVEAWILANDSDQGGQ